MVDNGIIFGNRILDVVFIAWALAQTYKVISEIFTSKTLNIRTLWSTGGMPSSHSSTVSSLATCIAIVKGFGSVEFSMAAILAGIVMYDASGIRRAAGKQAGIINRLIEKIGHNTNLLTGVQEEKLKELLGHSPIEVFVGAVLGVCIGILFKGYLQ